MKLFILQQNIFRTSRKRRRHASNEPALSSNQRNGDIMASANTPHHHESRQSVSFDDHENEAEGEVESHEFDNTR